MNLPDLRFKDAPILVTGATGFLGRHLIPELINHGYRVRALVRPTSHTEFLTAQGVTLAVASDITDLPAVTRAAQGCRAVIHAAGNFRFWGSHDSFYHTNVQGTRTVLNAALAAGASRFVHVSSIAVAGKIPPDTVINEEVPCQPQDPYQQTKLMGEQDALAFGTSHNIDIIVVRPGAFYGPWGRYAFNRLFFFEPLHGWRIRVSRGRPIQFPAFVPDVAQGLRLALERGRPGEIYNISGRSLSHNEANDIISTLADISRFRLDVPRSGMLALAWTTTQLAQITGREPIYPYNLRLYVFQDWPVAIEKAKNELGFEPTPFAEGARQTLKWIKDLRPQTTDHRKSSSC